MWDGNRLHLCAARTRGDFVHLWGSVPHEKTRESEYVTQQVRYSPVSGRWAAETSVSTHCEAVSPKLQMGQHTHHS